MHAIKRLNRNILSIESSTNSYLVVLTRHLKTRIYFYSCHYSLHLIVGFGSAYCTRHFHLVLLNKPGTNGSQ